VLVLVILVPPLQQSDRSTPTRSEDERHPVKQSTRSSAPLQPSFLYKSQRDGPSTKAAKLYPRQWGVACWAWAVPWREKQGSHFSMEGLERLRESHGVAMAALIGVSSWHSRPTTTAYQSDSVVSNPSDSGRGRCQRREGSVQKRAALATARPADADLSLPT
jgi:hypothetical protein